MNISVVIPSYRGSWRLERMLESVADHDPDALRHADWLVVEDPSDIQSNIQYHRVVSRFPGVEYMRLARWSNMHGAAQEAFRLVSAGRRPADWIIYLGDDLLVTPFAISNMIHFLRTNDPKTIALVQFPYWNAHDLTFGGYDGKGSSDWHPHGPDVAHRQDRFQLLCSKEEMYLQDPSWLRTIPENPHWNGPGYARPYVNVNGAGFACHRSTFQSVGGFAEGTWCLDESISVRVWQKSNRGIVCLPGPCLVHYFGGATESGPPKHDLHTAEAWTVAMGMTKEQASVLSYSRMEEMTPRILEETKSAAYLELRA